MSIRDIMSAYFDELGINESKLYQLESVPF